MHKPSGPDLWLLEASRFEELAANLPRFSWIIRRRLRRQAAFLRELVRIARRLTA